MCLNGRCWPANRRQTKQPLSKAQFYALAEHWSCFSHAKCIHTVRHWLLKTHSLQKHTQQHRCSDTAGYVCVAIVTEQNYNQFEY